jgi:UDP-glucose:(heptosyl)LPS alpha-1,3-glucosyltransferase
MSQDRLRIAFVVHMYNNRMGHSRYVVELAERYARLGHEVHVFANVVDEPRPAAIRFHHVPAWRWKALTLILSFIIPSTLLVRGRFDVIHAQGLSGLRQTVTTAHICLAGWLDASRRINGRLTVAQHLARLLVVPLERLTFLPWFSPQVIAISETNRRDLGRFYRRTKDVEVVYHGIDLVRFNPAQRARHRCPVRERLGVADADLIALYVGDLKKGASPTLRALARVPGAHLVMVSASAVGPYQDLARELGLERRVHFCPATPAIEQYYAAADLFVFPTLYDAFGMVILEAMASGLPVVTTRAAGAAELIDHQQDGLILEDAGNVDALVSSFTQLIGDPGLRTRLGQNARFKAEQFTWDKVAERTLDVYRRACGKAGNSTLGAR